MIEDKKAEDLENKGLYRRAAERWSEVMHLCASDFERSEARRKRDNCTKKSKRPPVKQDNFSGVLKAARETQHRMGVIVPKAIKINLK